MQEARVVDDPEQRWSRSKLNKNELLLLLGLLVQAKGSHTFRTLSSGDVFVSKADELLAELHGRILKEGHSASFDDETKTFIDRPETIGMLAREAIYYGAESFYVRQLLHFSRLRYRDDATWLLQKVGLSIRSMIDIAKYILERINAHITALNHMCQIGQILSHGELTNSLLFSKSELRKKFGEKADAFIARFSTSVSCANDGFDSPFAINGVAISPIIDIGEHLYIPNQYRLAEAVYESPFYWMLEDLSYSSSAGDHRGAFLEHTTAHLLRSVFGNEHVYENVTIRGQSKDIAGEVDVLVIFGEFVLVVQAKSKRVTQKARAGDTEALRSDFEGAIEAPYRQAKKCLELIRKGATCSAKDGRTPAFLALPRLFPIVVLSDPFPAVTLLSKAMLEREDGIAPIIWDIGVLDVVVRLLPDPVEMIYFLKCRSDVFDRVMSDSEYNFLGYHLRSKLTLPADADFMVLERDFATLVDDFMISADVGLKPKRPIGILERLNIPVVAELLSELKKADPVLASVVIDLYDFSSAALEEISAHILNLRDEIAKTGKAIKAFSVQTPSGGLTYAVTLRRDKNSMKAAEEIGTMHKYNHKSDRWYVIHDCVETSNPIDGLLPLVWPCRKMRVRHSGR
ncbi:MAG: NERD domain-containing protein [Magnetococcales bacterium]|nr:NERD domain-containing protein [Magnetococcales bacterium]